jgi:uncharacterized protein YdgA (DUF945 family)
MKKFLAWLVLLGVAAGLPYWGGLRAEREYRRLVASLPSGERLRVIPVRYDRGWLESTARMRVELGGSSEDDDPGFRVLVDHRISHGPLAFAELLQGRIPTELVVAVVETDIRPELDEYPALAATLGEDPIFSVLTSLYSEGYGTAEFTSTALQKDKDWGALGAYWQGASGTLVFTRGFKRASGALRSSGLDLVTNDARLRVRGFEVELEAERDAVGLPIGGATLEIASVQIADPDLPADSVALRDVRYEQSIESDGELLRLRCALRIAAIARGEETLGPAELELVVRNVDANALIDYRRRTQEIARSPATEDERQLAHLAAALELVPRVLSRSPEIELVRFSVHGDDGDLEATAQLGMAADVTPSPLLAAGLAGRAELRIPSGMLHRVAESVLARKFELSQFAPSAEVAQGMEEAELAAATESAKEAMQSQIHATRSAWVQRLLLRRTLLRDGESYVLRAAYAAGQLQVNDVPLDLGGFLSGPQTTASIAPTQTPPP